MLEHPWTAEFAEIPEDASPPLYMTPVPADAVGSYAVERCECCDLTALEWIERAEKKQLRWWQRLAVVRQLEHRADGSLCHHEIVESCPRRAGKSVRLRGVALWRMSHGQRLFGEVQTVVHTGNNLRICREVQRGAWRWAETEAGWEVTRANGKEAIETPDLDRWMVFAQDAVYGYDCTLALGDECWDVKPDTVTEGLEPATLERSSPQVHLTSTAHRRATSLMRKKILGVLFAADTDDEAGEELEGTLLLIWAAPHGSDPSDPEVWKAASPYWSESRRRLIAGKHRKAVAGEIDPEADDPDPMAGFVAQYLNVWPMRPVEVTRGEPIATEHTWPTLAEKPPTTRPRAAAIESWFGAGVSLAVAWKVGDRAVVAVTGHPDLAAAVAQLRATKFAGVVTVGASLRTDPALTGLRTEAGEGRTGPAAAELARLMRDDTFRHDGNGHLGDQVLAIRTVKSADGARLVSNGRADAVKAAVWAARKARAASAGKPRIVVPKTASA
jgi:hypothetical protein